MAWSFVYRALLGMLLLTGVFGYRVAAAQEALPSKDDRPFTFEPSAPRSTQSVLDLLAKDVRFDLLARPDAVTVRLPLAPADWSLLKGMQPYVALSPSTVKPIEGTFGLATPAREATDEPLKGLGMGAGLQWHLSDRLDLFGQYQFVTLPGGSAATGSPIMRRDSDNPGVRAGFSVHF
jgi:hypothetical protein